MNPHSFSYSLHFYEIWGRQPLILLLVIYFIASSGYIKVSWAYHNVKTLCSHLEFVVTIWWYQKKIYIKIKEPENVKHLLRFLVCPAKSYQKLLLLVCSGMFKFGTELKGLPLRKDVAFNEILRLNAYRTLMLGISQNLHTFVYRAWAQQPNKLNWFTL